MAQPVPVTFTVQPIQPIKQKPSVFDKDIMFYLDDYQEKLKKNPEMFMKITIPKRMYDYPNEKSEINIDQFLNELQSNPHVKTDKNKQIFVDNFVKDEDSSESECEFKCNFGYIPDYYPPIEEEDDDE